MHLLPASTKNKLELATYEAYKELNCRSVTDIFNNQDKLLRFDTILKFHDSPAKLLADVFLKSLDQVHRMTGVKNWIDGEGARFFMDHVLETYNDFSPADIQVFCNQVIVGEYGESYENISVQKLITWFRSYAHSRSQKWETIKTDIEKERINIRRGDTNPDGIRRIGREMRKLGDDAERVRQYLNLNEYCERNKIKFNELVEDKRKEYHQDLINKGFSIDEIEKELYEAHFQVFLKGFISSENRKISSDNRL